MSLIMKYLPQLTAFLAALGGAIGINFVVGFVRKYTPDHQLRKPLLAALPIVIGGAIGYWIWAEILTLALKTIKPFDQVDWQRDFPLICIFMGIGQGATAQSIWENLKYNVLSKDGFLIQGLVHIIPGARMPADDSEKGSEDDKA